MAWFDASKSSGSGSRRGRSSTTSSTGESCVHPSVYRLATSRRRRIEQRLLAACWATGAQSVASHASAAWLWGLFPATHHPTVTVPEPASRPAGVEIHRLDIDPTRISFRSGIPYTDPCAP